MIDRVIFTPEADDDVAESYDWYEISEPALGKTFFAVLKLVFGASNAIQRCDPIAIDEFRRAPIRRFPFEIFYEPSANTITIYSVFHCSQDPQKWRERLG